MREFQVYSVITTKDLEDKGFIVHTEEMHPDAFYTTITKGDISGCGYINEKDRLDFFPENYMEFARELCKSFPDIQILNDDQYCEIMHMDECPERYDKFNQMVKDTIKNILEYDPSSRVRMKYVSPIPDDEFATCKIDMNVTPICNLFA